MSELALATIDTFKDQILHCDAETLSRSLPQSSIDLIVVDPKYGIGYRSGTKYMNNGREPRRTAASFGADVAEFGWLTLAYRALKANGAMYLFTRWDVIGRWSDEIRAAGFEIKQRIIWDKAHFGQGNLDYYGSQIEDVLFCVKGEHKLRWSKREGNIWYAPKIDVINIDGNYDHPTQKPTTSVHKAILYSSSPGDIVCDPFCGSGSFLVAAQKLKRHFVGCDIEEKYAEMSRFRLAIVPQQSVIEVGGEGEDKITVTQASLFQEVKS